MKRLPARSVAATAAVALIGVAGLVLVAGSLGPARTLWSQQVAIDATVVLATATNTVGGPTNTPTNTPVPPTNTPTPVATALVLSCGTTSTATCTPQDTTPAAQNQLVTGTANGSVLLNSSGNVNNTVAWWKSVPTLSVTSRTGWSLTADVSAVTGSVDLSIAVWRTTGTCGNPPASSDLNYVAGGLINNVNATGIWTSPSLTPGTNASPVPAGGYVCLRLARVTGSSITLRTNGASILTGAFTIP